MRSVGIRAYFEVEMTGLMRDWIWGMREEFKNQNRTFPCNLLTKFLLSLRKTTPSYTQSQNKNLGLRFIGFFPRVIIKFYSSKVYIYQLISIKSPHCSSRFSLEYAPFKTEQISLAGLIKVLVWKYCGAVWSCGADIHTPW